MSFNLFKNNQFSQNMSVLVYFHGGEFKYGGKYFYKPDYLLENAMIGTNPGIIVVTVNYRLGVLGECLISKYLKNS